MTNLTGQRIAVPLVHVNPIDREILVLRFVAELEFQEIADIMHMGLSATKMRYKRALDRLREKFAGMAVEIAM